MEIITYEMEQELAQLIDEQTEERIDGADRADLIASDPRLAHGVSPQRWEEIDEIIEIVTELFDRFVAEEMTEDPSDLRGRVVDYVRAELESKVEQRRRQREAVKPTHNPLEAAVDGNLQPEDSRQLLTSDSPQVRFLTTQWVTAEVRDKPELGSLAQEPLLRNLEHDERVVQAGAARSLVAIAKAAPDALTSTSQRLLKLGLIHEDRLVRLELLTACIEIAKVNLTDCDAASILFVNTAVASLTTEKFDEIREKAAGILAEIAEQKPAAVATAYPELWRAREADPYPAVRAHASSAIDSLKAADTVTVNGEPNTEFGYKAIDSDQDSGMQAELSDFSQPASASSQEYVGCDGVEPAGVSSCEVEEAALHTELQALAGEGDTQQNCDSKSNDSRSLEEGIEVSQLL